MGSLKLEDRIRKIQVALKRPLQPPRREADDDVQSAEGTPGELGTPKVSAPEPALISNESEWPW